MDSQIDPPAEGLLVFFLSTKSAADVTNSISNNFAMSLKYLEGSGLMDIDVKTRTKIMSIRCPVTALEDKNMFFNFTAMLKLILGNNKAQVCHSVWWAQQQANHMARNRLLYECCMTDEDNLFPTRILQFVDLTIQKVMVSCMKSVIICEDVN
jgi:hypothetical protein